MNRLVHLRETLPQNIENNKSYPHIEFVILDYNSQDGLEEWVRETLGEYIESGIVSYYKTYEPQYFNISHSKNMALKLAKGDIVCFVDADNYAGEEYVHWVNRAFTNTSMGSIVTTLGRDSIPYRDVGGKLGCHRNLLYTVRGFDEGLVGYGVDDVDLVNRLENAGGTRIYIKDEKFLRFIGHSHLERLENYHLLNNLVDMYVMVTDHTHKSLQLLFLLADNSFYDVSYENDESIRTNPVLSYGGWRISQDGHRSGTYERSGEGYRFMYKDGSEKDFLPADKLLVHRDHQNKEVFWRPISKKEDVRIGMAMFYTECLNRYNCLINVKPLEIVNENGWGRGTVYRNFDQNQVIVVN